MISGTKLVNKHLYGWKFKLIDNSPHKFIAFTQHSTKTIYFSRKYAYLDDAMLKSILLHEIAHAKVGPGHGHDAVWMAQVRALGGHPNPTIPVLA